MFYFTNNDIPFKCTSHSSVRSELFFENYFSIDVVIYDGTVTILLISISLYISSETFDMYILSSKQKITNGKN